MVSRVQMVGGLAALTLVGAGTSLAVAPPPVPRAPAPAEAISAWTALAAYSTNVVDPDRLCYWDFRDERWIPADSDKSVELRKQDPRPVFREPNRGLGRCGDPMPAADIGALGAVLGAFVYIATKEHQGHWDLGQGTPPPPPPPSPT